MEIIDNNELDIGKKLKQEKIYQENQEKIEVLKKEHQKQQQKWIKKETASSGRSFLILFIAIIFFVAIGVRIYVASMPITDAWAEQVVTENLKIKVSNAVYETYPTLSESKKQELIQAGIKEAVAAEQNQEAIQSLSETYKQSYKDPEGNSYLYEIDPYYFYDLANDEALQWDVATHAFLPFSERYFYVVTKIFLPGVSFVEAIAYIPLMLTLFCAIILFFLGKALMNETVGFVASLFFVLNPILLEFSLVGFTDTNMLNIFFILASGLLFVLFFKEFFSNSNNIGKLSLFIGGIIFCLYIFRYTWSAWYIGIILIFIPIFILGLYNAGTILFSWKTEQAKTKKHFVAGVFIFILLGISAAFFVFQTLPGTPETYLEHFIFTPNLKKYLHIEYKNPFGSWPEAFGLIKELQQNKLGTFIRYLGGALFFCFFIGGLLLSLKILKDKKEIGYLYLITSCCVFFFLSLRAVRLLPYFLPFFGLVLALGFVSLSVWLSEKITKHFLSKENKSTHIITIVLIYIILSFPLLYIIFQGIEEKSNLIPLVDDPIYNSALFIKENSNEYAQVSTWWDRGTIYKALAGRLIHLHSQPAMPRTYWLASFYMAKEDVEAKNTLSLINCEADYTFYTSLTPLFGEAAAIAVIQETMKQVGQENQTQYLSALLHSEGEQWNAVFNFITTTLFCSKKEAETYVVLIDDLMPRFSAVEYFAAWNFEAQQPDPEFPYSEIDEYGCGKTSIGAVCSLGNKNIFLNFTSLEVTGAYISEVYLVFNNTVQYKNLSTGTEENPAVLIVYNRAGYWKAVYLPKVIADSMYVRLMLLDGYNAPSFEKVFDEVHVETSWVKVYKVNWAKENNTS